MLYWSRVCAFVHLSDTCIIYTLMDIHHIMQCTLQSCLMNYVKSETVHDVMCPQCSKVGVWLGGGVNHRSLFVHTCR